MNEYLMNLDSTKQGSVIAVQNFFWKQLSGCDDVHNASFAQQTTRAAEVAQWKNMKALFSSKHTTTYLGFAVTHGLHWTLCVLSLGRNAGSWTAVLSVFNSLPNYPIPHLKQQVKSFVDAGIVFWRKEKKATVKMRVVHVNVVTQDNSHDCGLCVLHNWHRFVVHPERALMRSGGSCSQQYTNFQQIVALRGEIRQELESRAAVAAAAAAGGAGGGGAASAAIISDSDTDEEESLLLKPRMGKTPEQMSAEAQARSSRQAARAASTMAAAADGDGLLAQKRAKDEENARRQAAIAAEFPDESPAVLLDPGFASDLDSDTDSDIDGEDKDEELSSAAEVWLGNVDLAPELHFSDNGEVVNEMQKRLGVLHTWRGKQVAAQLQAEGHRFVGMLDVTRALSDKSTANKLLSTAQQKEMSEELTWLREATLRVTSRSTIGSELAAAREVMALAHALPTVTPLGSLPLRYNATLFVSAGSVLNFGNASDWSPDETAVVNAANTGGIGGAGVDAAFCARGGDNLAHDRQQLKLIGRSGQRIPEGGALCTGPNQYGDLFARNVIHAVGPKYAKKWSPQYAKKDKLLRSAYVEVMRVARKRGIAYIGFSLLSAGVFKGARDLNSILQIGLDAIIANSYPGLREVHMIGFKPEEQSGLQQVFKEVVGRAVAAAPKDFYLSCRSIPQQALTEWVDKVELARSEQITQLTASTGRVLRGGILGKSTVAVEGAAAVGQPETRSKRQQHEQPVDAGSAAAAGVAARARSSKRPRAAPENAFAAAAAAQKSVDNKEKDAKTAQKARKRVRVVHTCMHSDPVSLFLMVVIDIAGGGSNITGERARATAAIKGPDA